MEDVYAARVSHWWSDLWLRLIAFFKLLKATLLVAAGIGALGLLNPHTAKAITGWATALAADRHYHLLDSLVSYVVDVDERTLRLLSIGSFLYAMLFYTEGFGLFFDKRWAEYLTIATTAGLIPFEAFELVRRVTVLKLEVLVEIHSYYQRQIEVAHQVDWVYDFALPPLVLHAFFNRSARFLKHWIEIRPVNSLTVLDTHDGIGVIDIGPDSQDRIGRPGLVPDADLDRLVQQIHANSKGESLRATGSAASNLDLYQVNCTFYDALGRDDTRYLLARAIQFFLPGVPQVYYVGLFAGHNDMTLLEKTGVGRDINRHYYNRSEIESALEKPLVERLFELIRLRNTHPAFQGTFELVRSPDEVLDLRWSNGQDFARLRIDLRSDSHRLEFSNGKRSETLGLLELIDA